MAVLTILLLSILHSLDVRLGGKIDILFGLFAQERGSATRLFEGLGADRTTVLQRLEALNPVD